MSARRLPVLLLAVSMLVGAPARTHSGEPVVAPAPPEALGGDDARGLGRTHGSRHREAIRELLGAIEATIEAAHEAGAGGDDGQVMARAVEAARQAASTLPQALREEMAGIAEGADVPYDRILLLNLGPAKVAAGTWRAPTGTNVVVGGPATTTGEILHGSHLDGTVPDGPLRTALQAHLHLMVTDPPTGRAFASIGWPGMVGTPCAMNAAGLTVSGEAVAAPPPADAGGLPLAMVLRDVVQHATSLDDAVERLVASQLAEGARITVSDGERLDMRVVEKASGRVHVRVADGGFLLGADDLASPECFLGACDPDMPPPDETSRERHARARTSLTEPARHLRADDMEKALEAARARDTLCTCLLWPATREIAWLRAPREADGGGLLATRTAWMGALSQSRRGAHGVPPRVGPEGLVVTSRRPPFEVPGARRHFLSIPSPRPSGFAFNDTIPVELWLPEDGPPRGVLLQLPAWKERTLVGHRALALALARQGLAMAIVPLPYQNGREPPGLRAGEWTLSSDLARTRQALLQGLADVVAVSHVLERDFDLPPARQAIGGVSLGAHVAATALGLYPRRFAAGACVLAGGRIHEGFMQPNSVTGRIQRELMARGLRPEEGRDLLAALEPLSAADPTRGEALLLIAADRDDAVTPERARALAEAWRTPHLLWLEGGHYAPARPDQALRVLEAIPQHLLGRFPPR